MLTGDLGNEVSPTVPLFKKKVYLANVKLRLLLPYRNSYGEMS